MAVFTITGIACEEECGSSVAANYKVTDYLALSVKAGREPLHNEISFSPEHATLLDENAVVDVADAGFVMEPTTEDIAMADRPGFFSSAFACKPKSSLPSQKITNIEIFSSSDYVTASQTFPANTNLISLFGIGYPDPDVIADYLNTQPDATKEYILFVITTPPASEQKHEFKIAIYADGVKIQSIAKAVFIRP
jgi:hypothetical protein